MVLIVRIRNFFNVNETKIVSNVVFIHRYRKKLEYKKTLISQYRLIRKLEMLKVLYLFLAY